MKAVHGRILFEDNHLLAINKLSGELSQSDETGDISLEEAARGYIKEKYGKPGKVFLQAIHRIDRPVSGALLFARTSKAVERMTGLLREHGIKKTYWAIVGRKPPKLQDELFHYLRRMENKNVTKAFRKPVSDAKESKLTYRVLQTSGEFFLLEVLLETGRHHQIRAQLADIGCPIVGDVKYGYPVPLPDASIALHARSVEFIHPVRQEPVVIVASPPHGQPWLQFEEDVRNVNGKEG